MLRAVEIARGSKERSAQPRASFELEAPARITSIVRVPVREEIKNCLAVLDQSNRVYILSLISLDLIWENGMSTTTLSAGTSLTFLMVEN